MSSDLSVLGISGSLRRASLNSGLLRAAAELHPPSTEYATFELADIPLFNSDLESNGPPKAVVALQETIKHSDGLLLAVPEYNYSISGVLKNALDWASRGGPSVLDGKPLAIMGAGGRYGTVRAQLHMRQIALHNSMRVMIDPDLHLPRARSLFDNDGNLTDAKTRDKLRAFMVAFTEWITHSRTDPTLKYR